MKNYYRKRAPVYDRVYSYPERQDDLRFLEEYISKQFAGLDVLEIAAGTGYWTQFIIQKAKSVLATDIISEALAQIELRPLAKPVAIKVTDAYFLDGVKEDFTGTFAGLWISHVPRQSLSGFLTTLHSHLQSGSKVLFVDNTEEQCSRLPLTETDQLGNTYQERELDDGSVHRVLKNFPTKQELLDLTVDFGNQHKFVELDNFWLFQYVSN